MMKTLLGVVDPPPPEDPVAVLLDELDKDGYTPSRWARLRKLALAHKVSQQQWRRIWRDYHPNGKRA